jgi:hypothetical protein
MHPALFLPNGKLSTGPITAAIGPVPQQRRLFVVDVATKERFLVDTGAEISVYPVNKLQTAPPLQLLVFEPWNFAMCT